MLLKNNGSPVLCPTRWDGHSRSRFASDEQLIPTIQDRSNFKPTINHIPVTNKESVNCSRMVAWILASVAKSILLVASSRMMIELFRSNARAMAISCLCPWEKFIPPADTWVSSVIEDLLSSPVGVVGTDVLSVWLSPCSLTTDRVLEEMTDDGPGDSGVCPIICTR